MNALIAAVIVHSFGKTLLQKLEGLPISLIDAGTDETPIQTTAKAGKLEIKIRAKDSLFAKPFMVCHELGHAAAATEDEIYQPNLGLPSPLGQQEITERITEAEFEALAFQGGIIEACGGDPKRETMLRLCKPLFKIKPARLKAAYESPDYTWDAWTRRITRNLVLVISGVG